jgi:uncharacterized protein YjiS (DUF1127 family)
VLITRIVVSTETTHCAMRPSLRAIVRRGVMQLVPFANESDDEKEEEQEEQEEQDQSVPELDEFSDEELEDLFDKLEGKK